MSNNGKQPVYPCGDEITIRIGLTKREYFTAMAMQGLLAATNGSQIEHSAKQAVIAADELLKALEE